MNPKYNVNTKLETLNTKQIIMTETQNSKRYDLEDRTLQFAKEIRLFVSKIRKSVSNIEDGKQLVRSSGSVGANYIEANEALGKKDFAMRIKICRKEAKESIYWLQLLQTEENKDSEKLLSRFISEATQLMKIFGAIIKKRFSI